MKLWQILIKNTETLHPIVKHALRCANMSVNQVKHYHILNEMGMQILNKDF